MTRLRIGWLLIGVLAVFAVGLFTAMRGESPSSPAGD